MENRFFLRGTLCWTPAKEQLQTRENALLFCDNGLCGGVYDTVPETLSGVPVYDYSDCLIFPGMVDLHIHAPQFAFRGTGMDFELLDWLKIRAFPEESKYADLAYAERAYTLFAEAMRKSATTRAVVFGTMHRNATLLLMDLMENTGLISYVGKVNMDRDAPPELRENSAEASAFDTFGFVNAAHKRQYQRTFPILTPRFIPSCSDSLLSELSEVRRAYDLPVQSHLSENPGEVALVRSLMPDAAFYGDGYDRYGLFGGEARTVMAHCVHSPDAEAERMLERGVYVAHCPDSNSNLRSGIAPIRKYLRMGMRVGLGTDVAAGHSESMFRAIADAVQMSKLYQLFVEQNDRPLLFSEAFYLATKGGGSFFGKVGSFEEGYEFDALVLQDSSVPYPQPLSPAGRLERAVYLELDRECLKAKFVRGRECLDPGSFPPPARKG